MGCVEIHESIPAMSASDPSLPSSPLSAQNCIWVDADSSHTTLIRANTTSFQSSAKLGARELHSKPTSQQILVAPFTPNALTVHHQLSVSDEVAPTHVTNMLAMGCGCLPTLDVPVAPSEMCAAVTNKHVPSLNFPHAMAGSVMQANDAVCAIPWSPSTLSVRGDVANSMLPFTSKVWKASPSRPEFLHCFVSTLLPELEKIHSQRSPISLEEKFSAVRLAADMSLAVSAGTSNVWSQALFVQLVESNSDKEGLMKSNATSASSTPRGEIYTSILRRSSCRGSPHAVGVRGSQFRNGRFSTSHTFRGTCWSRSCTNQRTSADSLAGSCLPSDLPRMFARGTSHTGQYRKSCRVRSMRCAGLKRHVSYVKVLRASRSAMKLSGAKSAKGSGNEASKAHVPSISREQIASLSRLVPGGHTMDVPLLFQEAAGYILSLQMQVEALKSLSHSVAL